MDSVQSETEREKHNKNSREHTAISAPEVIPFESIRKQYICKYRIRMQENARRCSQGVPSLNYIFSIIIMGGLVKQNLVSHSDMLVSDHRRRGKEKN